MSTVDSAASLFGGDDVGGDPFSSIVNGDQNTPATAQATTDELFGNSVDHGHGARDTTADLFTSSGSTQTYGFDAWGAPDEPQNPLPHTSGTAGYGGYGQAGQLQSQALPAQTPSTGYGHQQQSYYGTSQTHDPYAPSSYAPSTHTSAYSNASYTPSPAQTAQASYGSYTPGLPYSPAQVAPTNPYTPTYNASPAAPAYDPYQPSAYTPASQAASAPAPAQSAYSYSTPSAYTAPPIPAIPAPPKPSGATAEVYRPKTSNAYDPPIPPSRTKRAASSHYGRVTSPPVQAPLQPPLPPPPPRGYATPPPPRNYNTPPPPARASNVPPPAAQSYNPPPPQASQPPPRAPPPQNGHYKPSPVSPPHVQAQLSAQLHPSSDTHTNTNAYTSGRVQDSIGTVEAPAYNGQTLYDAGYSVSQDLPPDNDGDTVGLDSVGSNSYHQVHDDVPAHGHSTSVSSISAHTTPAYPETRSIPEKRTLPTSPHGVNDPDGSLDSGIGEHQDDLPVSPAAVSRQVATNGDMYATLAKTPYGASPYGPPNPVSEFSRVAASASTQPHHLPQRNSLDMPKSTGSRVSSPAPPSTAAYDPYKPTASQSKNVLAHEPRTTSPSSMSVRSSLDGPPHSYAPPPKPSSYGILPQPHVASSTIQQKHADDPYAPSRHVRRETGESSGYGDYAPRHSHAVDESSSLASVGHPRETVLVAPTYTPYAPSPTLLGSNDPLGRVAGRAPVFSFGFGGKLVTCFHGSGTLNTGFDVAMSSRQCTDVRINVLHNLIPASALDLSETSFPGPLFHDPGTPTAANLVRTGAAQTKTKKARVAKYLEERAEELSRGLGYLHAGSDERRGAEGRVVLISLLKVMVEYDGRLTGSAQAEAAVRSVLAPHLANAPQEEGATVPATTYAGFAAPIVDINEIPLATYNVKASALDKITEYLIQGDRRKAVNYALDEKMWAHALVISSSIDKEAWKDVVNEFVRAELGRGDSHSAIGSPPAKPTPLASGRESLRVAYNFFAGQGAAAVQEMVPPHLLLTGNQLGVAAPAHITPISPNFPQADLTSRVPPEALSKWTETAAMLFSNPMSAESSSALVALGDYLLSNQWTEAAHACYLLSGQLSLIGGVRSPSVRIVLLGSQSPHVNTGFYRDPENIILSEVLEFALSLTSVPKGQEPFSGLPHLQAYKLVRAWSLSEVGHASASKRYCEAIAASVGRNSPYVHPTFYEQLNGLADRLVAAPQLGKPGSWIGGKVAKPSLDGIGSWLEGRLTKFIAGEGEDSAAFSGGAGSKQPAYVGPFSHYSSISSAAPSTSSSPQPTMVNPYTIPAASQGPQRSGSAMAVRPTVQAPVDRASSAMDVRHRASPIARVGSASGSFAPYGQTPPSASTYASPYSPYAPPAGANNTSEAASPLTAKPSEGNDAPSMGNWWDATESTNQTPTAPTFHDMREDDHSETPTGFISLMDSQSMPSPPATSSSGHRRNVTAYDDEDDDDLGLGNASRKKVSANEAVTKATTQEATTPIENAASAQPSTQTDNKPAPAASSGSWLGRLWGKRSDSTAGGPVKANLGEESSFYYDKELKRWVNKKAGDDAPKPAAPPPPPSRTQTASPQTALRSPMAASSLAPPPRPASAVDLNSPPRRPPPRLRPSPMSNGIESAPTTPALGDSLIPPPPSRPRSQASKRNVRSRYVDVFQSQPDGTAS